LKFSEELVGFIKKNWVVQGRFLLVPWFFENLSFFGFSENFQSRVHICDSYPQALSLKKERTTLDWYLPPFRDPSITSLNSLWH
jgi:hypothetical protein